MPLYTNANKWAPTLVIVLQLATWTIVGIIFLQRGAIHLHEKSEAHVQVEQAVQHGHAFRRFNISNTAADQMLVRNSTITKRMTALERLSNERIKIVDKENSSIISGENEKEHENQNDEGGRFDMSEEEKSLSLPPVNRTGAAVAVVMLAIGVVMLLLGPAIVILRAIDARRRTTESFSKLRTRRDLPPSYEEVTLMDQVPRYSTLHLDGLNHLDTSIHDLEPPPSIAIATTILH